MERLRAADYFGEALTVLAEYGSESLTIAVLCSRLDVTKGSFYHHFGSVPGFVTALLAYWEREYSMQLVAIARAQPDPALRLGSLSDLFVELPHESEAAIRAWGRSNDEVAQAAIRVDRRRERHLTDCVTAVGVERTRARLVARIILNTVVGVAHREQPVDRRRLRQMLDELSRVIALEADPRLLAALFAVN